MLIQGRLKKWNDGKGFGFIAGKNDSPDIFLHISAFNERGLRPQVNQPISYEISTDKRGRLRAINASMASTNKKSSKRFINKKSISASNILAVVFIAVLTILIFLQKLPFIILYWYLLISMLTFAFYKVDKEAAKLNYWRTKENTLHVLSLLGGWPGALIGQQMFRHKISKTSFKIKFWLTLMVNLGGFGWLFTQQGQSIFGFIDDALRTGIIELFAAVREWLS